MTALNQKGTSRIKRIPAATSYNGNEQFAKTDAIQLYELIVMSLFGKDAYYESNDARLKRLEILVNSVVSSGNLDFVANAIIRARHVMNIRSMPLVLTVYFAKAIRDQNKQYDHMRQLVGDVIARADEPASMLNLAIEVFGDKNKVPMALKRGIGDSMNKFNEYQFAKWG